MSTPLDYAEFYFDHVDKGESMKAPAEGVCHLNAPVPKNCRSCYHSEPINGSQWRCNKWNAIIPKTEIPKGCDSWQQLPTR